MANKPYTVIVGVSTYGMIPRAEGWVRSFWSNTEQLGDEISIVPVMIDDGTPNVETIKEREHFCEMRNVNFLHNEKNLGIPATWNRILTAIPNADLAIIFNDDIRLLAPGWLSRLIHFTRRNEKVGTVGLPLVQTPGFTDNDPRWWGKPGRVGAAVGCAFAIKPADALGVKNPDNSIGYYEDLLSFHEEITMGFRLAEQGKLSYMLPWPPAHHAGGATFGANPELIWRDPSDYLTMDEFLRYVRACAWYVPDYEKDYAEGKVDRMSYSRVQFSKYWGVLEEVEAGRRIQEIKGEQVDILNEPQKFVHARVVDPWPARTIYWVDREGNEQEYLDA